MAWTYKGDGAWYPGVPARDLTDEEYAEFIGSNPDLVGQTLYVRDSAPAGRIARPPVESPAETQAQPASAPG